MRAVLLGITAGSRFGGWGRVARVSNRLPSHISLATQEFQKGDQRRGVDQHEVIGNRQGPELDLQAFAGESDDRGAVQCQLAQEGEPEPVDGLAGQSAGGERRYEQERYRITHRLVRDYLKGEHLVPERIERMAVTVERAQRLFDHAHPHAKLVLGAPVGVFDRDRLRLVDGAQTPKMDFSRDREVVDHVAGQLRVTDSTHGVQTSAHADERTHVAFAAPQEFFVSPVGTAPTAYG